MKFIICCPLCNYDLTIAALFEKYKFNYVIFRHIEQKNSSLVNSKYSFVTGTKKNLLQIINRGDVIINGSNSFFWYMGIIEIFRFIFLKNGKVINYATGSDITELAVEKSRTGFFYRILLKKAVLNIIPPYIYAIKNMQLLKNNNFFILRYPYLLDNIHEQMQVTIRKDIIFFCPSNLDFGINDSNSNRNSTKGNHKFIKAFCRAYQHNKQIKCILLNRGPDRDKVYKFIPENCKTAFSIIEPISTSELKNFFSKVDCVVDQFDVGGFGMIAMEAMSQKKPVMIYIDNTYWPLVYDSEPPIINSHTEDEIYQAILEFSDRNKLQVLGEKAETWVRKYHDVHMANFAELILKLCIAANIKWPREDIANNETQV